MVRKRGVYLGSERDGEGGAREDFPHWGNKNMYMFPD